MVRFWAKRHHKERQLKLSPRRILWMIIIPVVVVILVMALQNSQ